MMKFFRGFALAFSMLSIFPFFKVHDFFRGINGYAVASYPLVGFVLGCFLWTLHSLLLPYFPQIHLNIIIFAFWVLFTGALHLDGFCDTIDGLFVPKQKALEVMKDPHNGGMGMVFGGVFLILKASSMAFFDAFYLLPFVLMISRYNASLAIYFYPYISDGMGALAKKEFEIQHLFVVTVVVFLLSLFYGLGLLFAGLLVLVCFGGFFKKHYGGLNGDMYGFVIEVSELVLLNCVIGFGL